MRKKLSKEQKQIALSASEVYNKTLEDNGLTTLDAEIAELDKMIISRLSEVGYHLACPNDNCRSTDIKKNGTSRGGLQRYICKTCGKSFTLFTDTVLAGIQYPLPVIIKIIKYMISGVTIPNMSRYLKESYPSTYEFDETSLAEIRIKIMKAIHEAQLKYFEANPLTGIIQIDETYFHENQSGTPEHNQYNPYEDIRGKRTTLINKNDGIHSKSRNGSIKGDEFSNVVVAVNSYGLCISALIGVGHTDRKYLDEYIMKYIDINKVDVFCSDANSIFDDYCVDNNLVHYVLPSGSYKNYNKIGDIDALGHPITEKELFEKGKIGIIKRGKRRLGYKEFKDYESKYYLSLKRVNGIHSELKKKINGVHNSVVTKNLNYYTSWYCFLRNYPIIFTGKTIYDERTPFMILAIILQHSMNMTRKKMQKRTIKDIPRITGSDLKKIVKKNNKINSLGYQTQFATNPEAHSYRPTTDAIKRMSKGELQDFALFLGLKGCSTMKVEELRHTLFSTSSLSDFLIKYDIYLGRIKSSELVEHYKEDEKVRNVEKEKRNNKNLTPAETFEQYFAKSVAYHTYKYKGSRIKGKIQDKTLFIDIETTGLNPKEDEILELAIVNGYGNTVFHCMFKPIYHTEWPEAEKINHIKPSDVETMCNIEKYRKVLHKIFKDADELIFYNANFDFEFIRPLIDGRILRKLERTKKCCMTAYKELKGLNKNFKLIDAAKSYNIDFNENELHGALYDAQLTREIWVNMFPTYF